MKTATIKQIIQYELEVPDDWSGAFGRITSSDPNWKYEGIKDIVNCLYSNSEDNWSIPHKIKRI